MAETPDSGQYRLTEKRIEKLTLAVGVVASVGACIMYSIRVGVGVLVGAVLAWLNFRLLEGALDSLARAFAPNSPNSGVPSTRIPLGSLLWMAGRYALIGAAVYVIFFIFKIPVLSMLVGLCALGAATIAASLYEVFGSTG
jgi:hypothetical protein